MLTRLDRDQTLWDGDEDPKISVNHKVTFTVIFYDRNGMPDTSTLFLLYYLPKFEILTTISEGSVPYMLNFYDT